MIINWGGGYFHHSCYQAKTTCNSRSTMPSLIIIILYPYIHLYTGLLYLIKYTWSDGRDHTLKLINRLAPFWKRMGYLLGIVHHQSTKHVEADVWKSIELLRSRVEPFPAKRVTGNVCLPTNVGRSGEATARSRSEEYCWRDTEHCTLNKLVSHVTVLPPESVTYVHVAIVLMTYIPPYNLAYSMILWFSFMNKFKLILGN